MVIPAQPELFHMNLLSTSKDAPLSSFKKSSLGSRNDVSCVPIFVLSFDVNRVTGKLSTAFASSWR